MADEARALLDALMGGDRNAPLPPGAAVPKRRKKQDTSSFTPLMLPTKRNKSCYDPDVCPLYCAWGIDVYELFVNTKSDLGPNPHTPDDGARQEYLGLPKHEQERMGYEAMLFQKLSDLVRSCDRTVSRNKEKLQQELQRQLQKREGKDYVEDIDDQAVESLARSMVQMEDMQTEINRTIETMEAVMLEETKLVQKQKEAKEKQEPPAEEKVSILAQDGATTLIKAENPEIDTTVKEEDGGKEENDQDGANMEKETDGKENTGEQQQQPPSQEEDELSKKLQQVTLRKQRCMFDLARKMQQYAPLQESVDQQTKQLHFVKSDITSDKTVCEVSGNFMSARDADERIAAHYAGKQYVGWKLVRDKLKEMQAKHGRYGPPSGSRSNTGGDRDSRRRYDDRRSSRPDDRHSSRGGGGGGGRGGDRFRRGSSGDWERGGSRGHRGSYDDRGRDRRGGGGGGYGGGGGSGYGGGGYGGRGGGWDRDRDRGRWRG